MATGDIKSVSVGAAGNIAVVTIDGWSGSAVTGVFGNIAEGTASVVFSVVSEGYDNAGNLGTLPRTVYGVAVQPQADSGSDRAVTINLSDPIFNDDKSGGAGTSGTDPTVSCAAGAFTRSGGSFNAATGLAVTNNSTLDYPVVKTGQTFIPFGRETSAFPFHRADPQAWDQRANFLSLEEEVRWLGGR